MVYEYQVEAIGGDCLCRVVRLADRVAVYTGSYPDCRRWLDGHGLRADPGVVLNYDYDKPRPRQ